MIFCVILVILLANDKLLLRRAVVDTYNQWRSDIYSIQTLLQTSSDSPANPDSVAIQKAYDAFNITSGKINNAVVYPSPASRTKQMAANLNFELNNEFNALQNDEHPDKDRAFLAAQFVIIAKQLPQKVNSVSQLGKLSDDINEVTEKLHKNFASYLENLE